MDTLEIIKEKCIECPLCQRECQFLKKYGTPKKIAEHFDPSEIKSQALPFECSLCGLCTAVCPVGVDPAGSFLEMRRETVRHGGGIFPEHAALTDYEWRGMSPIYSYYGLPAGCDTVFFPGCTLSGTRSEKVVLVYEKLKETIPSLGIVLDCCTKPSHDLGRQEYFLSMFEEMRQYLVSNGIKKILVACPNCYKIFARYGTGLSIATISEILAEEPVTRTAPTREKMTVHDPCAVRFEATIHESVRKLIEKRGYTIEEMPHSGRLTLCCGEGGAVGVLVPDFANHWSKLRQEEAAGRKIITYCAGCANMLGKVTPTLHVLDTLWEGKTDRAKVTRPPLTYWKRLRLKRWFKKNVPAEVFRERKIRKSEKKGGGLIKLLIFLFFLGAVIAFVKTSGLTGYLEQETLRAWIGSYGAWAPIIYMAIYTLAPALFLPGLPITVVGGILFGPVWGVIYTITSATAGACVAFLVSRYLAREWVEGQLKSPRWRRLDEGVDRHGWKVVAFTRLIPIFPFNLLNYAFGLTKIRFFHYALATFLGMLPACIAYIVFSSSLLDLIRGRISVTFVIGFVLVIIISGLSLIYRRYKAKSGQQSKKIVEL